MLRSVERNYAPKHVDWIEMSASEHRAIVYWRNRKTGRWWVELHINRVYLYPEIDGPIDVPFEIPNAT